MQKLNLKAILLFSALILFSIALYNFKSYETAKTQPPARPIQTDENFLIACMQSYNDPTNYHAAGFNGTHIYDGGEFGYPGNTERHTPVGRILSIGEDKLVTYPINSSGIQTAVSNFYNNHNGSRMIWMRPKIEWLSYGQSSIYEAESISLNDDYWFYSYNDHIGEPIQDDDYGGVWVQKCSLGVHNPGFIVSRLKANTEQCRRETAMNQWQGDSECDHA